MVFFKRFAKTWCETFCSAKTVLIKRSNDLKLTDLEDRILKKLPESTKLWPFYHFFMSSGPKYLVQWYQLLKIPISVFENMVNLRQLGSKHNLWAIGCGSQVKDNVFNCHSSDASYQPVKKWNFKWVLCIVVSFYTESA